VLATAQHVKHVPGRTTDVQDAEWLAELLRHGPVRGSFVPDKAQRELRELTRNRTSLVEERAAAVDRLQKVLEGANVKLASVATDVTGPSARAMLAELVAGATDAAAVAELARGRLREKIPALQRALAGRVGPHQRFLLAQQRWPTSTSWTSRSRGSTPRSRSARARRRPPSPGWTRSRA
jgi:transposase